MSFFFKLFCSEPISNDVLVLQPFESFVLRGEIVDSNNLESFEYFQYSVIEF